MICLILVTTTVYGTSSLFPAATDYVFKLFQDSQYQIPSPTLPDRPASEDSDHRAFLTLSFNPQGTDFQCSHPQPSSRSQVLPKERCITPTPIRPRSIILTCSPLLPIQPPIHLQSGTLGCCIKGQHSSSRSSCKIFNMTHQSPRDTETPSGR